MKTEKVARERERERVDWESKRSVNLLSHVLCRRCELDGRRAGWFAQKLTERDSPTKCCKSRAIGRGKAREGYRGEVRRRRGEVG